MKQIAQIITQLPKPPTSADMDSFDLRADAFLPAIVVLGDEVNKWAGQTNAVAQDINDANLAAQAAKEAAERAQAAAEAVTDVQPWEPGKQYDPPQCAVGSDGHTYRAVQPSTGVDPVADETGAWVRISASGGAYKDISPGGILVSGGYRLVSTGSYTLVTAPKKSTQIDFMLDCEPSEADKITIVRGGETIGGRAEDMTVEDPWIKKWTMVFNGTTWVVLI